MTKEEKIEYWIQLSDEDLDVAKDLFVSKHWLYTGFMCHQAVEKILKAYWCSTHEEAPQYTHNIIKIASDCGLSSQMSKEQNKFIMDLMPLNIEARYPDYKNMIYKQLNVDKCQEIIANANALVAWIKEKIKY